MKYPIGIQTFEEIRNKGFVYVDKTRFVFELADRGKYYFLSRPRRFGKSLLLSTFKSYFLGHKHLFRGLAIDELEEAWMEHPILHLDLNTGKYDKAEELDAVLNHQLATWETLYGSNPNETSLHVRFLGIIERAYRQTGQQVVILVDEYDKPMLQAIGNDELLENYRDTLKAFYSVLKTQDAFIRFAFLTGVTKFGKVSVFSDLNNLQDLSMLPAYADICGITEEELHEYFDESIRELAAAGGATFEETCDKLRLLYDGYHFCEDSPGIYNPFSLLNTFNARRFGDYWFETGTPTFLVNLLKQSDYDLRRLQEEEVQEDVLNSIDSMSRNPVPVIYQSGYLTVKGFDEEFRDYRLGFPNKEVERGFIKYLMPFYTPANANDSNAFVRNFVKDVQCGNPERFMERLQTLFDESSYEIAGEQEKYFQNAMYVIFKMMGFYTEVERRTSRGRIDVVVGTTEYIYVIELKLNGSAVDALRQIEEKGYAAPFAGDPRRLFKIGVNFSGKTRSIVEWKIQ